MKGVEISFTNACHSLPSNFVNTLLGFLDMDEKTDALNYILSLCSMKLVPPAIIIKRLMLLLLESKNLEESLSYYRNLKQIHAMHPLCCCNLLWRGVCSADKNEAQEDSKFFIERLQIVSRLSDTHIDVQKSFLLLEYFVSVFEEEHIYHIAEREKTLYKLLKASSCNRKSFKEFKEAILEGFIRASDMRIKITLQRLLYLYFHLYCNVSNFDIELEENLSGMLILQKPEKIEEFLQVKERFPRNIYI